MPVIKINKENFASEVLNSNKPVLLDFYLKQIGYTNAKSIGGISSYRGKVVK